MSLTILVISACFWLRISSDITSTGNAAASTASQTILFFSVNCMDSPPDEWIANRLNQQMIRALQASGKAFPRLRGVSKFGGG